MGFKMRNIDNFWGSLDFFNKADIRACAFGRAEVSDRSSWEYMNFTAPFDKLYFIESGTITVEILNDGGDIEKTVSLTPGNVYIIPCGNKYNLYTETGFVKFFLHINIMMSDGYDLFNGINDILFAPYHTDSFDKMQTMLSENDYFSILKTKSIAYDALIKIIENNAPDMLSRRFYMLSHYPTVLLNAIQTVSSDLSAKLTVENVAGECGVSGQCLSKSFIKYLDITPKKYIEEKLCERASILLLSSNMTIKEVASELKFNDQYAFSKFFKRASSYSPSEYRVFRTSIDSKK